MTRFALTLIFASAVTSLPAADDKADKAKAEEFKALTSGWKVEKAISAGNTVTTAFKDVEFAILADGRYSTKVGGSKDEGTFTLDLSTDPKGMVITSTEGGKKGTVLKAAYKLDGDTLTICYDLAGKTTPTKLESTAENKFLLIEYKRKK